MNNLFDMFFELLMMLEGGYVNNPVDKGGRTNYGITAATLKSYNTKYKTNYQSKTLTKEQAKEIYNKVFFESVKPNENIPSYYHYFDLCVNSGFDDYKECETETKGDIRKIMKWRKNKYASVVKKDESQIVFLKGWYNRLNRINNFFGINIT